MNFQGFNVMGFDFGLLLVIFILLGCALFVIYWLWVYPCDGRVTSPAGTPTEVISAKFVSSAPKDELSSEAILYAVELEPGTVILQSQNGDLFRILREFDSVANNGTFTSGLPPGACVPVHYIPAYTRAHVQNKPSAPFYQSVAKEDTESLADISWQPLCIQSGNRY